MRIVYVTTTFPYAEGEAFLIPEIGAITRRGHEVLIVPRSPGGEIVHGDARPLLGTTVAQPLFSRQVARAAWAEVRRDPRRALRPLLLLLKSRNPEVFLKNLAVYAKGLWLARIAREWGATHIHAHWAATVTTIAMVAGEVSAIPWSFTAHRFDVVENNLLPLKARRAAFVRYISQSGLGMAGRLGASGGNARVLHMGVDVPELPTGTAAAESSQQPGRGVILCPANLLPVKGHKYLIEALAALWQRGIELSLWIAGQGELRGPLQRQVELLGLTDAVRFLGQVSHAELLRFYEERKISFVVLPSVDLGDGEHEGIPVALIEAMSYGVPVVSTETGGIPELLQGGAGLLVPPADPLALADALERLRADADLRGRVAEAGRKRVLDEYSISQVVSELIGRFQRDSRSGL